MTATYSPRINSFLNISIVACLLLLVAFLSRSYLLRDKQIELSVGDRLSIKSLAWVPESKSVLLFLRSDCTYCTNSAGFYRKLSESLQASPNIRIAAVFSNSDHRSNDYMREIGLSSISIYHTDFSALGIKGTPTLALVNGDRVVEQTWYGRLSSKAEIEVLQSVGLEASELFIGLAALDKLRSSGKLVTILDIREREYFAAGHIQQAYNIPFDEISVRAVNEIPSSNVVVIVGINEKESEKAADILLRSDFDEVYILESDD